MSGESGMELKRRGETGERETELHAPPYVKGSRALARTLHGSWISSTDGRDRARHNPARLPGGELWPRTVVDLGRKELGGAFSFGNVNKTDLATPQC